MTPRDLRPEQFSGYPPEARRVVVDNLDVLRELPLSLAPSLLREIIDYDFRFPAERKEIDHQLATLKASTPEQLTQRVRDFAAISVSKELEKFDWINQPSQFLEQLSAYLWSSHQMDAFRRAATEYADRMNAASTPEPLPTRRLGIAVIGAEVETYDRPLFRNLRAHGTLFTQVTPEGGLDALQAALAKRASAHPAPYGHWYIDGGSAMLDKPGVTCVSFGAMAQMREALLKSTQAEIARPGNGPEELRTYLTRLTPADLGVASSGDVVLDRFKMRILTEGSGTQIFSTTFVQWTVREALRRAQPLTLMARFAPRQRQRPMNELLAPQSGTPETDPVGSLVDGDMSTWYHWINQQRLAGNENSAFIAWFEGHNQAIAISPAIAKGKQSSDRIQLTDMLSTLLA